MKTASSLGLASFLLLAILAAALPARGADEPWLVFPGGQGPGEGKHIVLVSGDEEYRSEEALPQLALILSERHGFQCTVLFAIDSATGEINPDKNDNIPGLEALEKADLMILFTRLRKLPDEQMKHIADYVESGRPIVALRTATHAFANDNSPQYSRYGWQSQEWPGGFGRQVLGETWINHHGNHGSQSTRGLVAPDMADHPILRGIKEGEIWGPTDVYGVTLPLPDCQPLVMGQVLEGMTPTDKPVEGKQNDPMMPVAWIKAWPSPSGRVARIFCTTMGAAPDFVSVGLRRLVVNASYWAVGLEEQISEESNVDIVGEFQPLAFGFGKYKPGVTVAALRAAAASQVAAGADAPQVPALVGQLLQDRDYPAAIADIDEAVQAPDAPKDYLAYLKARALHLQGQYDAAVEAYDALGAAHPDSPWARRGRFGKALSLARKGDFQSAEVIYRAEVSYLLSVARKQEIADIYLEFADAYFKPQEETQAPDYQKALNFYEQALAIGPEPERRIEVELLIAQCHQSLGNLPEAANRFSQFAKAHPGSPLVVEARYRLGECQLGMGQPQEARRTWQDLLADKAEDKSERIAEAAFNLSLTYGLPNPGSEEQLDLGVASLEAFLERFPEHKLAGQAHLRIARSYAAHHRYESAVTALNRFLADERYADREETPHARSFLGQAYALQKKFPEALTAWRDYLARHPAHESWSAVQQQIINVEYLMGLEQRQKKQYDEARRLWNEFLVRYPLDPRSTAILFEFGAMEYEQDHFDLALTEWRRLVSKYPQTEDASRAQFMIAATLEEKLSRLEDALKEYRKLTWGGYAQQAQARIHLLTSQGLSIVTPRVFRTDETPKIKLTTRNVESVTVRAYTVDLETYFRKMHLAQGVEGLDIALIDPDASFEFAVPKYAEFAQLESEIEVPLPKQGDAAAPPAGVLAVTISSKTLEATTMIIQSDLDVIVKSSREEVFVFAQNMRTGEPWPEARLLISNGSQVFAEAATGPDGVFQQDYKELADAADVRVFATATGSIASNIVGLDGLGVATGLSDRGYIYTDRPAYRAGQVVHVRGIIRRATGDEYTIEAGRKHTVDVFDPRGRLLRQEQVELGEYGSFHIHFVLPAASPAGGYRIQVRDDEEHSYEGTFLVHEYQLEPVQLSVETERRVFYRGEEIEGTIKAAFYYGAPLADREIRYQLADGRVETATTDAKGEVHFKLPTRDFREAQTLPLVVTLAERNLQTAVNFYLAVQGFSIGVNTVRDVYVLGETFEVSISTQDAEGKPTAQKLTLSVLERTTVDGKVGERLVEQHELATDEEQGQARVTLRLEQGGSFILRAEGADRFKNPVSGERAVQVSDDEDTVRLRILSDRHTYKVGDTADVKLHWREAPALALVTFQGAKVLGYQLVHLQTGANDLPLPMAAKLAPNFELSVAVMTDARRDEPDLKKPVVRFHEATSPFAVERGLKVTVSVKKKEAEEGERVGEGEGGEKLRPGDKVEVIVSTTDPQGKPVAAEVSLAMVEQALLDRFGPAAGAISGFFHGGRREPAVRTRSSITFIYLPQTQPINPQLLAEADRREVEAGEAVSAEMLAAAEPDFEQLQDLISATIEPQTWSQAGGSAAGDVLLSVDESSLPYDDRQPLLRGAGVQYNMGGEFAGQAANGPGPGQMEAYDAPDYANQILGGAQYGWASADLDANGSVALDLFGRPALGGSDAGLDLAGDFSADDMSFDQQRIQKINRTVFDSKQKKSGAGLVAANADDVYKLGIDSDGDIPVLLPNGEQWNLALKGLPGQVWNLAAARAMAAELEAAGAVLLAASGPQETGYWNPAVVTDAEGQAVLTFTLPERSTAWTFAASAITTETLAGEASESLVVSKDLFGELKLPLAFTDGDEAQIVASVHNALIEVGQLKVTLKTTIGDKSTEETQTIDVTEKGIQELIFKSALALPKERQAGAEGGPDMDVTFELTVAAGETSDVLQRVAPLKPHGMRVFVAASGSAASDITAFVEPAADMPLQSPHLQVVIGPTVERSLLDIVLGAAPWCQIDTTGIASSLDTATSDLMAALGLQKLLGATRDAGGPQAQALDERVRASVSLLVASQNDDGGWSWTGQAGGSNRYASAQALWAISLAKQAGYPVPQDALDRAIAWLSGQVPATGDNDHESKAILLQALATAGQGDFALANRLYRSRQVLSSAALARLALAFVEMDRGPTAQELLDMLDQRDLDAVATRRQAPQGSLPWSQSGVEVRALYALALERIAPESAKVRELVDWLMAHRTGNRWSPDKATGPAALAVCDWFSRTRFEGEKYTLTIFVNDRQAQVLELGQDAVTRTIDIPDELLNANEKQRINFQLAGRGRFTYQCVLGGFVPADQLKSTVKDWHVQRTYEPAPLELDGQEVPRGFGVLVGNYESFKNPLTQLPVGKRGHVELVIWRTGIQSGTPEEQLEYLVVTEPLPSGVTVIEQSVKGGFERFEVAPGAITFYVGSRQYIEPIQFDVHGYLPGQYRAGPTAVRNAYRPEQLAVSQPKALTVLPLKAASGDEYRLSPQELYELGRRWFDQGNLKLSGQYLAELLAKWNANPDVYKDSARMLLDASLENGPPADIVRYFEVIKEKWPDLEIPFEKIVKVGKAYDEMGEYERSYLIFRATTESSFLRESGVAGFLEGQGEFSRSVDVMQRLLQEYPPEPYLAAATYALAQRVYAKAPEAAADAKLREAKINRIDLVKKARDMLEAFLTAYPEDPAADQAAFSLANALLEMESYQAAIAQCDRYAVRYADSDYLDSYWFVIGYCHFALGEHQRALEMCQKVSDHLRTDKASGREVESPNKWQAIYILGQVHHSLGEAAEAIVEYERVAERFPDAQQAIDYFARKAISLPEVTTVKPGEPAEVDLDFRNVARCDAKVYRIDLMKFSLLKRNLGGITAINLAGIRPYHEAAIELGDGQDYRDRTHKLALPLEEEGAYLVVCRGADLHASGLVLVTPLVVEVQEDVASGRVRATVKDAGAEGFVPEVHVKVIGSRNSEFTSGETDLRGIFVADAIQGVSTVIAQAEGDRYAFFRGQTDLGPPPAPSEQPPNADPAAAAPPQPSGKNQLLDALQDSNSDIQQEQLKQLQNLYEQNKGGVTPSEAF